LAALKKAGQQPGEFLARHVNREWGDLSDEDRKENDYRLEHGFRLLSVYRTCAGDKLWIITEADRSLVARRVLSIPGQYTDIVGEVALEERPRPSFLQERFS
jgi:hypothetical protein